MLLEELPDELLELLESSLSFRELDELSELVVSGFLESEFSEEESQSEERLDSSVFSLEELESSFLSVELLVSQSSFLSVNWGSGWLRARSVSDIAEEHAKNDGRNSKDDRNNGHDSQRSTSLARQLWRAIYLRRLSREAVLV